ncbi:MAG: cupin domain-containing protein [Chloroflexi bacterium]|nr:cupin domain-containing protein [Chloroflexota bacterium]
MPDTNSLQELGITLQKLREKRGLTLEQLSQRACVSMGLLSQLERGLGNPSYDTIHKLATGLGVPIASFFDGTGSSNQVVVKRSERKRLSFPDMNVTYELLSPDLNRAIELLWIEHAPGVITKDHPHSHHGEECAVLLKGTLEIHIGGEKFVLEAGDSIYFRSILPHWYHNPGSEKTIAIWAITPPSF